MDIISFSTTRKRERLAKAPPPPGPITHTFDTKSSTTTPHRLPVPLSASTISMSPNWGMIYVTKLRDMICINIRHHMEYPSNSTTDLSTTLHVHETWRMKKVVGTADNSLQMRTTKRFVINLYISDPYLYLHAGTVMGVEIRAQHAHNMEISVNMCTPWKSVSTCVCVAKH